MATQPQQPGNEEADKYVVVNTESGKESDPLDSWEEAQSKRNVFAGMNGADPSNFEIRPINEPEGTDDATRPEVDEFADGGQEQEPPETEPEPATVEPVEPDNSSDSLPDRELTEDPIAWLQQGDGELTTEIKGTTVITKKGFRVLQHKYDITTGSEVVIGPEETDHEFCRVKAWAEMPDGRRAEAHASAHVDRGDDHYLLTSMSDTRAKSRALSDVTGVGAVALEEMLGVEPDDA